MSWILLLAAGLFEIGMVLCLKLSRGFSRLWPSLGMAVSAIVSFGLLSLAMRDIPAGTAYAVWTGIGAVGAVVLGTLFLKEHASLPKFGAVALILVGVLALKLVEG